MGHRERADLIRIDIHQRGQRYRTGGQRRFHVEAVERGERALQLRQDLEDDRVGIELGQVLRHLALAIGVVERVVDQLRRNPEARGLVAIDGNG